MTLDVLAISAHPDDVEIACAGTIIMLVTRGRKVGLLDLTHGELGTRGTPEIRASEAERATKLLGAEFRDNLDLPDGNIECTPSNRLKVIQVIRKFRPRVLLFPHWLERHPDHEHTHRLCREAWFYAGLEKIRTEIDGKPQEPFRPRSYYHYMQTYEFTPSFVVDISDVYEQRMEILRAYRSQFHDPQSEERETFLSSPDFMDFLQTRFAYFGDRIGTRYGEPFYSVNMVGLPDISALTR
jgi:N-acetylglucosamine malate deacetylase 1